MNKKNAFASKNHWRRYLRLQSSPRRLLIPMCGKMFIIGAMSLASFFILTSSTLFAQENAPTNSKETQTISWQRQFDDNDRLHKLIDPAGHETVFTYSTAPDGSFSTTKTLPDGAATTWKFDRRGNLKSMTDGAGAVNYGYDALGRLNRVQRSGGAAIRYTYDSENKMTGLRIGDFYELRYVYDFLGRLESLTTPAGVITYEYLTGQGLVIRTLPNGVKTIWEYQANGRLQEMTHVQANNVILAKFTYEYRPDGLIAAIREISSRGEFFTVYTYDKVGRLIRAADQLGREYDYEYDQVGNRLSAKTANGAMQTAAYDWAGRLTSLNGKPTAHDAVGNLSEITLNGTTTKFSYNPNGQLQEVDGRVSYRYDGDGKLIERKVGGETTAFIPNPISEYWQPLVLDGGAGSRTLMVWDGNVPLISITDGKPEFMLHDHLGSVRLVTDGQGNVKQHIDYEPFGKMRYSENSGSFAPRFAGLFWDPKTSLYLAHSRVYNSQLGHFLQVDPQLRIPNTDQDVMSYFAYCGNDPINFTDRAGGTREWWQHAWRYSHAFVSGFGQTTYEGFAGVFGANGFWRSGGFSALMRGDVVWEPHPGTWADQAGRFSESKIAQRAVQGILGAALVAEVAIGAPALAQFPVVFARTVKPLTKPVVSFFRNSLGRTAANNVTRSGTSYTGKNSTQYLMNFRSGMYDASSGNVALFGPGRTTILKYAAQKWVIGSVATAIGGASIAPFAALTKNRIPFDDIPNFNSEGFQKAAMNYSDKDRFEYYRKRRFWEKSSDANSGFWGPGGPPGGPGGPDGTNGLRGSQWPGGYSPFSSRMTPSNVGGVYLGGAGLALEGIGQIKGLTLDANNNLVLLSETGKEIDLPPLRIDDVVTVFRSVYIYGEGPSVTIDPNPEDPDGSAMIVRHGKATENTYVGWVLYQADRLMKNYTLGVDNLSSEHVTSKIPGYDEVLDTVYFGDGTLRKSRKGGNWERFWIVPASSNQFGAANGDVTLFDVPLKVKTQVMKWENGDLVDDLNGESSAGATKFKNWFTENYDAIAREQYLTPPPESGIDQPVPVFTELERVALMTALAEKLRDQGVTMPFWMRDYEVRAVPVDQYTPGMEVTRTNGNVRAKIFGGVTLTPKRENVKLFTAVPELKKLPEPLRLQGEKSLKRANALSAVIQDSVRQDEPLKLHKIEIEEAVFNAIPMPGPEARALAPCRLDEADVIVPIAGGREIRLARRYNSFFDPGDVWGKGWTMNLPRLQEIRIPIKQEGDAVRFRIGYELLTPFNSLYARFSEVREVPALGAGAHLQAPDKDDLFFGLAQTKPDFLSDTTTTLYCKNGEVWHFTEYGALFAIAKNGFRTIYERNRRGQVSRIAGLLGPQPMGSIVLNYNDDGWLANATGKNSQGDEQTIRYEYDSDKRLAGVVTEAGKLGYKYEGRRVSAVTWLNTVEAAAEEVILRRFQYNHKGQLMAEFNEKDERTGYNVIVGRQGSTLSVSAPGDSAASEVMRYDSKHRPVEARYANGAHAAWTYAKSGASVLQLKGSDGEELRVSESADRRRRTLEAPEQPRLTEIYDEAGRLTTLKVDSLEVLRQQWLSDGRLQAMETESRRTLPQYDKNGLMTGVVLFPPGEEDQSRLWQKTEIDLAGRPIEVTDYHGLRMAARYDDRGELLQMTTEREGKNYGYTLSRDDDGRLKAMQSSWGNEQYTYDEEGRLSGVTLEKSARGQKEQAVLEFTSGRLRRVKQFDGGELEISYHGEGPRAALPAQVNCANGLQLNYRYNSTGDLNGVTVGKSRQIKIEYDSKGRITGYSLSPGGH